MKIFNRHDKKRKRSILRNEMNDPERILWSRLKERQVLDRKFRRQHGIGPFIVDFYCPSEKLVIEVDGDSHYQDSAVEYDQRRDLFMRREGLTVLRFTNFEIRSNIDGVVLAIRDQIMSLTET